MKKTIVILLSSAAIVVFTIMVSIKCFELFGQRDENRLSSIEVSLKDDGKGIDLDELIPIEDEDVENIDAYSFQVRNTGKEDAKYQVLIEEVELSNRKGYSKTELLSRKQLRYELKLNGKIIASDDMSEIKNNIIDERSVAIGKTNRYELKVWIPVSARKTDWADKYYRYKVNIQSVTEGKND